MFKDFKKQDDKVEVDNKTYADLSPSTREPDYNKETYDQLRAQHLYENALVSTAHAGM